MKRKGFLIVLVSLGILILPLIIDWCIFANDFPSNISNSDWASFLGGYIGAIVGGLFSLVGIVWTIRFTREQNQKDRELQVKPYCTIRFQNTEKFTCTDKSLGYYTVGFEPKENNGPELNGMILITNHGVGPAVDCGIEIDPIDVEREQYPILSQKKPYEKNISVSCIQPGDEVSASIHLEMNFDKITVDDIVYNNEMPEPFQYSLTHAASQKYKHFDINMRFFYHDILNNKYYQRIRMTVSMYTTIETGGKSASYGCDLHLLEIGDPEKIIK